MDALVPRDVLRVPGLVSLARLPLAIAFPFCVDEPRAAVSLLATAGATDLIDGWVARHFHLETPTGALLDGVMDKAFVMTVVGTLVARKRLSVPAAVLLCAREVGELPLLLGVAARGTRDRGHDRRSNAAGKIATALQFAALAALVSRSRRADALVVAAGVAGCVAALTYFARERTQQVRDATNEVRTVTRENRAI
jgi:CDP-diacylglycerol--glycerol-3-phosphate 3-phosphatidyltransferase/cardiolipin synthase